MPHANPLRERRLQSVVGILVFCATFLLPASAAAQKATQHLSLDGGSAAGARSTVTEGWTTLEFTVTNWSDVDRRARVLALYDGRPDVQYGRDVWVPARSRVTS